MIKIEPVLVLLQQVKSLLSFSPSLKKLCIPDHGLSPLFSFACVLFLDCGLVPLELSSWSSSVYCSYTTEGLLFSSDDELFFSIIVPGKILAELLPYMRPLEAPGGLGWGVPIWDQGLGLIWR